MPFIIRTTAIAALAAALMAAPTPRNAAADTVTVSPGDRIHVRTAICSLAYVYRGAQDQHTYAVTAAHCQSEATTAITDHGAIGTFIRAAQDPPGAGGADFALLDFGSTAEPGGYLGGRRLVYGLDRPQLGQRVCRNGATTGEHCGTVRSRRGPMQYLTAADMSRCAGGDSGGPVWIDQDGRAQIIGVWLGGITTADGSDFGRFADLTAGFEALKLTS